jgi:hypothetical protein
MVVWCCMGSKMSSSRVSLIWSISLQDDCSPCTSCSERTSPLTFSGQVMLEPRYPSEASRTSCCYSDGLRFLLLKVTLILIGCILFMEMSTYLLLRDKC